MNDAACVAFLQWAAPHLHLRWAGFRNVRGQVCKRLHRRVRELGLDDLDAYRAHLDAHADEWPILDALCRVTISRFRRDRGVFDAIEHELLPALAARAPALRIWSIGCASGEEPYTLAILARTLGIPTTVLAIDANPHVLERARLARYDGGTLRELPDELRDRAFVRHPDNVFELREDYRAIVDFQCADVRTTLLDDTFHVILCRNLVFTYFDEPLQRTLLDRIAARLALGGYLIIGRHESLPAATGFEPWRPGSSIYIRG